MPDPDRYDRSEELWTLARSLKGATILDAEVMEGHGTAFVRLWLDQTRRVDIGVEGNLHDEAFLLFRQEVGRG